MNRVTKHLIRYGVTLLLALVTLYACTSVDLCYEDYHPHRSAISVRFNWGPYAEDAPKEMNLIANRLYNTWRNHGIVVTESGECRQGLIPTDEVDNIKVPETKPADETPGSGNTPGNDETPGSGNTPGNEQTPGSGNTPGNEQTPGNENKPANPGGKDPIIPFKVRAGEYNFMAINAYEGLVIDKLQRYLDEKSLSSDSLFFHLEETRREELKELNGLDMPDFNPQYQYVHNPGRLFYGTLEGEQVNTGEEKVIEITPTLISKEITIEFNVHTIGDIEIENMLAEMSGICGRFNIMESYLDTTNLYRLLFLPKQIGVKDLPRENVDDPAQKLYTYSATFHIIGLVPSYRSTYLTGPGILQLAIYATSNGKRRVFYAGANPRKDLVEAKLMHMVKGKTYLTNTDPITITLSGELTIDAQHIINRDDGRFDTWFDSEGNLDIDV